MPVVWPSGLEPLRDAVVALVGEVTSIERLAGGVQGGAWRVRAPDRRCDAVLKARPCAHRLQLEQLTNSGRLTESLRAVGYPTPRWIGTGTCGDLVWQLQDYVDGTHVEAFDGRVLNQVLAAVELQAGRGRDGSDWSDWSDYARRVVAGEEAAFNHVAGFSPDVASLVARLRSEAAHRCGALPSGDIVHGDLNPSNVLVRDGAIVGIIDTGSAGRGFRAIDLATIAWGTPAGSQAELIALRRLREAGGEDGAVVALALHVWHMLEFPIRHQRGEIVRGVVARGHHVLDRLADS